MPTVANTIDADIQKLLDNKQTMIEEVLTARLAAAQTDRDDSVHKPGISLSRPPAAK